MKRPSTERAREVGALREKLLVAEEASRNACADTASTRAEFDAADAYRFFVMKAVGFWVFMAVLEPIAGPPMRRGSSPASPGLRESALLPSHIPPSLLSSLLLLSSFIFFFLPNFPFLIPSFFSLLKPFSLVSTRRFRWGAPPKRSRFSHGFEKPWPSAAATTCVLSSGARYCDISKREQPYDARRENREHASASTNQCKQSGVAVAHEHRLAELPSRKRRQCRLHRQLANRRLGHRLLHAQRQRSTDKGKKQNLRCSHGDPRLGWCLAEAYFRQRFFA